MKILLFLISSIFALEEIMPLNSINGGSGIHYSNGLFHIISDNSPYLYTLDLKTKKITKKKLISGNYTSKKKKLDWEAILPFENGLLLIPSGSKKNRMKGFFSSNEKKEEIDFSKLYNIISKKIGPINIEGTIVLNDKMYFFQRGNKKNSKNGIIIFEKKCLFVKTTLQSNCPFTFKEITLGKVRNVYYTFSDAHVLNNKIYFLASAEGGSSSYYDGEILGSLMGEISPTGKVLWTKVLSSKLKLEGLTSHNNIFYLISDQDNIKIPSKIYGLEKSN